jgi:hypothetical protein
MYITRPVVASSVIRCSSSSHHLLKPLFWGITTDTRVLPATIEGSARRMDCSSGLEVRCVETWRRPMSYSFKKFYRESIGIVYSTIADHVRPTLDPLSGQYLYFDKVPYCKHNYFIL